MGPKGIEIGAMLVAILVVLSGLSMAQQPGCMSVLMGMASCLNYVSGSASSPSPLCCSALANVVNTQPRCLCTIVDNGGSSLGVTINQTLALGLPSVCNVKTPPTSRCNVVNGPVGSPESAPPESGDGISPTSSVTGSKTTPSVGATSSGSTTNINLVANILVFITAAYASTGINNIF